MVQVGMPAGDHARMTLPWDGGLWRAACPFMVRGVCPPIATPSLLDFLAATRLDLAPMIARRVASVGRFGRACPVSTRPGPARHRPSSPISPPERETTPGGSDPHESRHNSFFSRLQLRPRPRRGLPRGGLRDRDGLAQGDRTAPGRRHRWRAGVGFPMAITCAAGPSRRNPPIMRAVAGFAGKGGHVLGICNGFQVLCETRLLPGALMRMRG